MSGTGIPGRPVPAGGPALNVSQQPPPQAGEAALSASLVVHEAPKPPPPAPQDPSLASATPSSVSPSSLGPGAPPPPPPPLPAFPMPPTTRPLPRIGSAPPGLGPMRGGDVHATLITIPLQPQTAPVSFLEKAARPLDAALPTKVDKVIVAILGLPGTIIGGFVGFLVGLVTGPFSKVGVLQSMKDGALCGAKWGSVVSPPFLGSLYTGIRFLVSLFRAPKLPGIV